MTATVDSADPVPLGYRFDVVWRGYSRRQVNEFVEFGLRVLTTDRDAAMAVVDNLTALLEESRLENRRLRERLDRLCRDPLSPDAVGERLRRYVETARAEAAGIVTRARAAGEHLRARAAEDARRFEEQAERRRRQIDEDFQIAIAARRAEARYRLREYEESCRAEAERLVRHARRDAARQVASAAAQVESLQFVRRRLAHRLRTVRGLFLRASALADLTDIDGVPGDDHRPDPDVMIEERR